MNTFKTICIIALLIISTAVDATECVLTATNPCTITLTPSSGTPPPSGGTPPPSGGTPPPSSGNPPSCKTMYMDWNAPRRLYTRDVGGFGPNDIISVQFTTPATGTGNSLPRFASAEYDGPPLSRYGVISTAACDFTMAAQNLYAGPSNTVTVIFAILPGTNLFYGSLAANTTYYFNMRNENAEGGNMFIDLVKPGMRAMAGYPQMAAPLKGIRSTPSKKIEGVK